MSSYTRLTHDDRVALAALRRAGLSMRTVAKELGKHVSTISRELSNNAKKNKSGYDARHARKLTQQRRRSISFARRRLEHCGWLITYVIRKLKKGWSPEQIAGRLQLRHGKTIVCHETIYRWIYDVRPDLKQYLRCKKGKYRRRHGSKKRKKARQEFVRRIDERPEYIEVRRRIGDLEGDTVKGNGLARLLTHNDRTSGMVFADKVINGKKDIVRTAAVARLRTLPERFRHSITYDNGVEFAEHDIIERETGMTVYFAYPYHSWERGSNENANGLLRQYFPKKTDFEKVTQKEIDHVVHLLNNRPRKRFGYLTPLEVFQGCCARS